MFRFFILIFFKISETFCGLKRLITRREENWGKIKSQKKIT